MKYYIMVGDQVEATENVKEWLACFSYYKTIIKTIKDETMVSTIFLGMDHNFNFDGGKPILFETMVFSPLVTEEIQVRYHTKKEAIEGHWKIVHEIEQQLGFQLYERPIKIKKPPTIVRLR